MWHYRRIPGELKGLAKWVVYGKSTAPLKQPFNPKTGNEARVNKPNTWATFEDCKKAVSKGLFCGVGFVFTGDYIVIDLDSVIDERGAVLPLAAEIIEAVDSYTETSISGRGFHIIARHSGLKLEANRARLDRLGLDVATLSRFTRTNLNRRTGELEEKKPGIEIYDAGRYVAITGKVYKGRDTIRNAPEAVEWLYNAFIAPDATKEQAAAVEAVTEPYRKPQKATRGALDTVKGRMFRGAHRDVLARLWSGDASGYQSESEAAAKLLDSLAFYTDRNPELIDALFRESGLYRPKWDERRGNSTHGREEIERAIQRAIDRKRPTYSEYVRYKATERR